MSRKRTGLRNKFRSGRSAYSIHQKSRSADDYGAYVNGANKVGENIAGHNVGSMIRPDERRASTAIYDFLDETEEDFE